MIKLLRIIILAFVPIMFGTSGQLPILRPKNEEVSELNHLYRVRD